MLLTEEPWHSAFAFPLPGRRAFATVLAFRPFCNVAKNEVAMTSMHLLCTVLFWAFVEGFVGKRDGYNSKLIRGCIGMFPFLPFGEVVAPFIVAI